MRGESIPSLLILEDDTDRTRRFRESVLRLRVVPRMQIWIDAFDMIRDLPKFLGSASLISLDHDLETFTPQRDPGDGRDVARFLSAQTPACAVIVHSSNADGARGMLGELELGGWTAVSVAPIGTDWVETTWIEAVRRLMVRS